MRKWTKVRGYQAKWLGTMFFNNKIDEDEQNSFGVDDVDLQQKKWEEEGIIVWNEEEEKSEEVTR
jgi:hypothetical protein